MSTISVIVPIYNAAPYLARCLDSIIKQSYRELQIILINDGSTDASYAIAERYAADDRRIELYTQPNQGQAVARNRAMAYATGEYISFVDADDYLDPDFYQTLIGYCDKQDILHFGFRRVTNDGQLLYSQQPHHHYRYTTPWVRLIRREWLLEHAITFPEGMYYEDVVFTMDLWLHHPQQTLVPYAGYNYVEHPYSTTASAHPADLQRLFRLLRQRKVRATWTEKLLINYTIIRLKMHFI